MLEHFEDPAEALSCALRIAIQATNEHLEDITQYNGQDQMDVDEREEIRGRLRDFTYLEHAGLTPQFPHFSANLLPFRPDRNGSRVRMIDQIFNENRADIFDPEDPLSNAVDLATNLLHWLHAKGHPLKDTLRVAGCHFDAETQVTPHG
jgi:hypothetical protein